jgi:hypothetical protein
VEQEEKVGLQIIYIPCVPTSIAEFTSGSEGISSKTFLKAKNRMRKQRVMHIKLTPALSLFPLLSPSDR